MSNYKPRYMCERKRKKGHNNFYWNPPPAIRKFGWKQVFLKNGSEFSLLYVAMEQANWLNAILDNWRKGDIEECQKILDHWSNGNDYGQLSKAPIVSLSIPQLTLKNDPNQQTLNNLIARYLESPNFQGLREKTQREYGYQLNAIKKAFSNIKNITDEILLSDIKRKEVKAYYDSLYRKISPNTAKARLTVLRLLFTYAIELDWITENPVKAIRMKSSTPRVVIWTNDEIASFIAHADNMGLNSMSDAVITACHTAQRMSDVLNMTERQYKNGFILVKQNKTNVVVNVPLTPITEERLRKAKIRNRQNRQSQNILNTDLPMFVCERTLHSRNGYRAWGQKNFNTWFNKIKKEVIKEQPSFENKNFQDLRDTAVTLLANAGADKFEIAAITGHSFASVDTVLKHYLSLNQPMANKGIRKMVVHIGENLIK